MNAADELPNPGSTEAIDAGCQCPVIDNCHGRGWKGGMKDSSGQTMFVYNLECPVHFAAMCELKKASAT